MTLYHAFNLVLAALAIAGLTWIVLDGMKKTDEILPKPQPDSRNSIAKFKRILLGEKP
jgi:hypothetical protein